MTYLELYMKICREKCFSLRQVLSAEGSFYGHSYKQWVYCFAKSPSKWHCLYTQSPDMEIEPQRMKEVADSIRSGFKVFTTLEKEAFIKQYCVKP